MAKRNNQAPFLKGGNHATLYTIIENGVSRSYLSDYGSGHYTPAIVLHQLHGARSTLRGIGMENDMTYIMPGIQYTGEMTVKRELIGRPMFTETDDQTKIDILTHPKSHDQIAECLTVDFDSEQMTSHHVNCEPYAGEDILVSFTDVFTSMIKADRDAERDRELPESEVLERSMWANLRMRAGLIQKPLRAVPLERIAAVYSFMENGRGQFFYGMAGGYSVPFSVLEELESMRHALEGSYGERSIRLSELMPLVDSSCLHLSEQHERLFQAAPNGHTARQMAESTNPQQTSMPMITVDTDNHCVQYQMADETLPADFALTFEDGRQLFAKGYRAWMSDMEGDYPTAYDAIERTMHAELMELLDQREHQPPVVGM